MEDILYHLSNGDYDITPERDKKQQELYNQRYAELEKIQAVFGLDFMNRLFDLEAECEVQQNYKYYRSGFILGAQLMLEALDVKPG